MANRTSSKRPKRSRKPKPKPDQPRLVRTSERTTFNRCEWQWWQGYHHQLTARREAPALRFGTLIHAALEERYPPGIKRGPKPAETFERLFQADVKDAYDTWGFKDEDGTWQEAGQLGVAMLENYVDTYGRDEEWKVVASEMTFKVPVFHPAWMEEHDLWSKYLPPSPDVPLFYYVGTMDGVWENRMDGGVRINDYKTTSNDPTKEAQGKHVLDEQATAYWTWGVDWLREEGILSRQKLAKLDGMLYTFLYKAKPDDRPTNAQGQALNKDGSVSKKQPVPRFHRELVYRDQDRQDKARDRAVRQFLRMRMIEDGTLPPYKSIGTGFPDQQCKACEFFDMCELDEIGAHMEDLRDSTMTKWEPYGAHEIQEEGKY